MMFIHGSVGKVADSHTRVPSSCTIQLHMPKGFVNPVQVCSQPFIHSPRMLPRLFDIVGAVIHSQSGSNADVHTSELLLVKDQIAEARLAFISALVSSKRVQ